MAKAIRKKCLVASRSNLKKSNYRRNSSETVLGDVGCGPNCDEGVVVGVVVAGEGVPAGLVPPVPPVLHQEGRALELQRVHTHLTVYEQLQ